LKYQLFNVYFWFSPVVVAEIIVLIFWNDIHFYIGHRALHEIKFLKKMHGFHHRFRPSTPFAAFAFHPVEALILGSVLPIAMLVYDFSIYSLLFLPLWSITINTISHANIKNVFISEHHQAHHYYYNGNYGFCFPIFDKILKTEIKS